MHLPPLTHTFLHLYSLSFICIHFPSFLLTSLHLYSLTFTLVPYIWATMTFWPIQVIKLKKRRKEKKLFMSPLRIEPGSPKIQASIEGGHYSARPRRLTLLVKVNFTTYFFSCDKSPIDMKMLVFFLGKCVWTAAKTMVVDRKKPEGTGSALFGVRTAAK